MDFNSESRLIKEIMKWSGKPSHKVIQGIGDDTAVVSSPKGRILATVDMMVEGIHFDLHYTIPQEIGHKALAMNLSDIASMGGRPLHCLVSLGLPDSLSRPFIKDLYKGLRNLAHQYKVSVIGGNIARTHTRLIVDVTVIGEVRKRAILRRGAKKGHLLAVTGTLGASAAGLKLLKKLGRNAITKHSQLVRAHLVPKPCLAEAHAMARTKSVTAMIDISDGLSTEVHHLAEESGVGFVVEEGLIPMSNAVREVAKKFHTNPLKWALHGGEDYQLLFALKPTRLARVHSALRALGKKMTVIGEVRPKAEGIWLRQDNGKLKKLEPKGWDHLSPRVE